MLKTLSVFLFLFSTMLLSFSASAKTIKYISDDLTIPMRTGTTMNHKILKFLNSGMAVEVLEQTEDQAYTRIALTEDSSKTGWVESSLLMSEKSGRDRLVIAKQKNQTLKESLSDIRQQLKQEKTQNRELLQQQEQLEDKVENLKSTLARLRTNAADPIRIADENEQLKVELSAEQKKSASLEQQNLILGDQNIKQWFMIGGGVSIGSLILGLIITRINWKKRDRWA